MKNPPFLLLLLPLVVLLAAGCSGKGDDVTDPNSTARNQIALIAVDQPGSDGLLQYSEATGATTDAYAAANGAPLGLPTDGIFSANGRVYLLHRAAGKITVLDSRTRKSYGQVAGFPAGDSGLCGIAASNVSDVWVIGYNTDSLYLMDGITIKIARSIPLPARPVSIATSPTKVFIGMQLPDGRGQLAIFSSNTTSYTIEQTIDLPTPPVYGGLNADKVEMVFVTAGNAAGDQKPTVYYVDPNADGSQYSISSQLPLNSSPLVSYIGKISESAAISQNSYLYLATPESLLRIDTQGKQDVQEWITGPHSVVAVDAFSDLVYASAPGSPVVQRVTGGGESLEDLTFPAPIRAMLILGSGIVQ
jgi:hypothetical protein